MKQPGDLPCCAFRRGFLINLLNPKSVLFAAAVLVAVFSTGIEVANSVLIVVNHFLVEVAFYMTLAFCLGAEVAAKRYRQAAAYIDRCASAVPGAPGFCLLWSRTEVRQAIHHKPATVREPAPAVAQGNSTPYPPVENRGGRGFPYKVPVRDPSRLAQRTNLSRFNPPAAPQRHGWLRNPTLLHLSDVDGPQPCARVRSTRRHGIPPDATLRPKSHQQG